MNQPNRIKKILADRDQNHDCYALAQDGQSLPHHLVIKQTNGDQIAFGYGHMAKEISYNPSKGICLRFLDSDGSISLNIQGRHLEALWQGLLSHKVTFISPSDELEDSLDEVPCVTKIEIKKMGE